MPREIPNFLQSNLAMPPLKTQPREPVHGFGMSK